MILTSKLVLNNFVLFIVLMTSHGHILVLMTSHGAYFSADDVTRVHTMQPCDAISTKKIAP